MSEIEKNENAEPETTTAVNAEYVYIMEDQDVWFVDYIIGIAFKTPIEIIPKKDDSIGLAKSGRPYREFRNIKDFQDYMEEKIGQEIDFESSIDPRTNLELDDMRITWHVLK